MRRRNFLMSAAAGLACSHELSVAATVRQKLTSKERVDRALKGADVDRPPFSFWHHFGLKTAEAHAERTLEFHRRYRTDIVKVMSDFPYPMPTGAWYELNPSENPFPDQIRALELIRDGLNGNAYFIETLFNPWNVAEKLSSKEDVRKLKNENPKALLKALDAIAQSEISHAKRALAAGASGILLSVANANAKELSLADYAKFSAPFDKRIMEAIASAKLNVLHLHVEPLYLDQFRGFPPAIINYSVQTSGIPVNDVRKRYSQTIMTGIDEVKYKSLTPAELREQWRSARSQAGSKFILTPGCSVPNDSSDAELMRLTVLMGA